jgi:transcriptional regulator with GAF, ATPase, and Fis domain
LDLGDLESAERLLTEIRAETPEMDLDLLRMQAWITFLKGNHLRAAEQVAHLRKVRDLPEDRIVEGFLMAAQARDEEARCTLREALDQLQEAEQPFLYAAALTSLGELERQAGDLEAARQHHAQALRIYRSLGNIRHTATASSNLGVVNKDLGEFDTALENLRQARRLFERVEDREGACLAGANLGILSLEMGDWSTASRRLSTALENLEALGSRHAAPMLSVLLSRALAEQGQTPRARSILNSIDLTASVRLQQHAARVEETLARIENQKTSQEPMPTREDESSGISKSVFRTIVAINRKLAACSDARQALNHVLESAVTLAGAREGYVLLGGQNGIQFELCTKDSLANSAFSRSLANKAISQQRSLSAEDALADQDLMDMPSVRDLQVKSALCVPFSSASGTSGALYVEHAGRGRAFSDVDLEILEVLADQAAIAIDRLAREEAMTVELEQSKRNLAAARRRIRRPGAGKMLGKSPCMNELRRQIEKFAAADLSVLILGETGTGKELVARAIHEQGASSGAVFISENCSAIPSELIESELFGHCKGAFTGADEDRAGLFELASGGTLFLDEIGDMPSAMQVKILRALQEGHIRRVGGQETIPVHVRLISATHRKLDDLVETGEFREDLYYRIAAGIIRVPPLRERGDDCMLIAKHFLEQQNRQYGKKLAFSNDSERALTKYGWPGNIRELEHVIARACILADGGQLEIDFPIGAGASKTSPELPATLNLLEVESRTIEAALEATAGDKSKAARALGISRTALYAKLKKMAKGQES